MNKRLKFYTVDMKYIRNLHKIDDHVPSVSPQIGKQLRPFLGVIVLVSGSKFCIPLTSNSGNKVHKFPQMRESITFRKIIDSDGKVLAGLNINNMIPVQEKHISEIDLRICSKDSAQIVKWKKLCVKELDWCQKHQDEIERLANELYQKYVSQDFFHKRNICLNFPALEQECNK